MIRFSNITKKYNNHTALNQINFTLPKGEMTFLTGHSGAGKSTLLKLIMMSERPTTGEIEVDDINLNDIPNRHIPLLRRQIGMVFQNPHLLENATVFENVALPLIMEGFRYPEIKKRVRAALGKVCLQHKEKALPFELSCGEQTRVGIARAIINKARILLADEPTGNLDQELSQDIMELFSEINSDGTTILIVTHNLPLVASLPYPLITLKQGRLISEGVNEI